MLFRILAFLLIFPLMASSQEPAIRFVFASPEQARRILSSDDDFVTAMSPFDRQVRMRSEQDPGKAAYLKFAAKEVLQWSEADQAAVRQGIDLVTPGLADWKLPNVGEVVLVHTSGREEGDAAYTRGNAIILPRGHCGSLDKPPSNLIAHELFHVLSRHDAVWRNAMYNVIGFKPVGKVVLPESLADSQITNPDAPNLLHAIQVQLAGDKQTWLAPVLFANAKFSAQKNQSMFAYLTFKLMEVTPMIGKTAVPVIHAGQPVLHDPNLPDFHRQIGRNTGYIIHPEEILADNFAAAVTRSQVVDRWVIDGMQQVAPGK
jgi:hypothetical protein